MQKTPKWMEWGPKLFYGYVGMILESSHLKSKFFIHLAAEYLVERDKFLSIWWLFACFELPLQSQSGLVDSPRRTPRALIFSGPYLGDWSRPSLFLSGRSAKVLLIAGLEIRLKDLRSLQTWFTRRGTWILGRERLRLQPIHFPPKGVLWCNPLGSLYWKV